MTARSHQPLQGRPTPTTEQTPQSGPGLAPSGPSAKALRAQRPGAGNSVAAEMLKQQGGGLEEEEGGITTEEPKGEEQSGAPDDGGGGSAGGGGAPGGAAAGGAPGGGRGAGAAGPNPYWAELHAPEYRDPRGFIMSADQPDFGTATRFVNASTGDQRRVAASGLSWGTTTRITGGLYAAALYRMRTAIPGVTV